jgi:DNA-binding NarL/FixJ family response regulator
MAGLDSYRSKVIVVDDQPLCRLGLVHAVQRRHMLDFVGEAESADEAMAVVGRGEVDLAIVEVERPRIDGVQLAARVRAKAPACKVLGLSVIDEPVRIAAMLSAGAAGYALKTQPVEEILDAIACVAAGTRYLPPSISSAAIDELQTRSQPLKLLTRREREIFDLLLRGRSNDHIAATLFISRRTVETHRQRVLRKLNVHTLVELFQIAARYGIT